MAASSPAPAATAVPPPEFTQCFWDLSQLNEDARVAAVQKLVLFAMDAQSIFERLGRLAGALPATGSSSDSAAVLCSEVQYAVKRLTKGIYSSHKAAREGFCLALTQLLVSMPSIGTEDVLTKLRETGGMSAKLKGQEQRDALLGRLFGYLAVIRSGRLASSQAFGSKDGYPKALVSLAEDVLALKSSKSWVTEFGTELIVALVETVPGVMLQKALLTPVLPAIGDVGTDMTPDALTLAFAVLRKLSTDKTDANGLPQQLRSLVKHVAPGQMVWLRGPLAKACATFPRLHIVWAHVLQWFTEHESLASPLFSEFWRVVVDEFLLQGTAEKKATGLALFAACIGRIGTSEGIAAMISSSLVAMLITSMPVKASLLHGLAVASATALQVACKGNSSISLEAVVRLLVHSGARFDKRTGSTLVSTLVSNVDEADLPRIVSAVKTLLADSRATQSDEAGEGVRSQLIFVIHALTSDGRNFRVIHKLYDGLLAAGEIEEAWLPSDAEESRVSAVQLADKLLEAVRLLDTPVDAIPAHVATALTATNLKRITISRQASSFAQLLLHLSGRLLCSSHESSADDGLLGALGDLVQCAEALCAVPLQLASLWKDVGRSAAGTPGKKKPKSAKVALLTLPGAEDVSKAAKVFVDVLLSLLSSSVRATRDVVASSFRCFASTCVREAVDMLIAAVTPSKDTSHDSDSDGHSHSEDDVEEVDAHDHDHSGSGSSSDEDAESNVASDDSIESSSDDDEHGSDSDPELAEMRRYDEALAKMLRERQSHKAAAKAEQVASDHFRLRALDLVEVAIHQVGASPQLYEIVVPLLKCLKDSANKSEQTKEDIGFRRRLGIAIAGVGKQKPPHANDGSGWTSAAALESLTTVVNFATKVSGREFSDAAWGVMWSLLRSLRVVGHVPLQGQQAADAATVGKLFGDAVAKFATEKSCCLSATVIHEFVKSCPIAAAFGITEACAGLEASQLEFRAVQVASYIEAIAKVEPAWSVVTSDAKTALVNAFTCCLRRTADTSDENKFRLDAKRLREVLSAFKFLLQKRDCGRFANKEELDVVLTALQTASPSPAVATLCRDCVTAIEAAEAKRKPTSTPAGAESTKKRRV